MKEKTSDLFSPAATDDQLVGFGRVLSDRDAFPVLCVLIDRQRSITELSHDMGADPRELKVILGDLIKDRLVYRSGKTFVAADWAATQTRFAREAFQDISLAGTSAASAHVMNLAVQATEMVESSLIGEVKASGPRMMANAGTNNHSWTSFASRPIVLVRNLQVTRETKPTSSEEIVSFGSTDPGENASRDHVDL